MEDPSMKVQEIVIGVSFQKLAEDFVNGQGELWIKECFGFLDV